MRKTSTPRGAAFYFFGSLGLASTLSATAMANPVVCAHQSEDRMTFSVNFNAQWEQGVKLVEIETGEVLRTFNNSWGQGAGGEWNQGAGSYTYEVEDRPCVRIVVQHKRGTANPSLPWNNSAMRSSGNGRFGYEDGGDNDFNDVRIRVRVRSLDGSVSSPDVR